MVRNCDKRQARENEKRKLNKTWKSRIMQGSEDKPRTLQKFPSAHADTSFETANTAPRMTILARIQMLAQGHRITWRRLTIKHRITITWRARRRPRKRFAVPRPESKLERAPRNARRPWRPRAQSARQGPKNRPQAKKGVRLRWHKFVYETSK